MIVLLCFVCSVDDTLDSILGGSDDEAEEDAVISQVLDEIGIEVTGKVSQLSTLTPCTLVMLHLAVLECTHD